MPKLTPITDTMLNSKKKTKQNANCIQPKSKVDPKIFGVRINQQNYVLFNYSNVFLLTLFVAKY